MSNIGFFEGLARRYPSFFSFLRRLQINGTGISVIDFHGKTNDGSCLATEWLTVGWLPIAPISKIHINHFKAYERILIPFFFTVSTRNYKIVESLPVDHSRSWRVYTFYWLIFFPALILPMTAIVAAAITRSISTAGFWGSVIAFLLWGLIVIRWENRYMKTLPASN